MRTSHGSPDPADPAGTKRILTIMLASECYVADDILQPPAPDFVRPKNLRQLQRLQPIWHGHYADLSCIYACINGLYLLLEPSRPLPPLDCEQLFRFAVRYLDYCDRLATTVERGVALGDWPSMVRGIANRAEDLACARIALARRSTRVRWYWSVFAGRYDHYTVIAGYSRTRFRLFDDYG